MFRFILYIFLTSIVFSCKKPNERTCFKGSGTKIEKNIPLDEFTFSGVSIERDINLRLVKDSLNYASIRSYENKVKQISFSKKDTLLVINDLSKCDFLRNYDKQTTVELHYKDISVLELNGNGFIQTNEPIENEIIHIYSNSSNSDIEIAIKAESLVFKFLNGTLSGKVSGKGTNTNLFHFGKSNVNFSELETENLNLTNKSDADLYINCNQSLSLQLESLGNIFYKGSPNINVLFNRFNTKIEAYN